MANTLKAHLKHLKTTLLELDATGHEGFEGLMAEVLGAIVGHPFRLAGAGSQHGKDGEAKFNAGHITFEGKLYSGSINKNEVLSKLTEIIGGSEIPDLWVLGATIEIKTQISAPLRTTAGKNAIEALILDWPVAATIPPLAAICAMADETTYNFLVAQIKNKTTTDKAKAAIAAIRAHDGFGAATREIGEKLHAPNLGFPVALGGNRHWLKAAFSDRKLARQKFGQPLAPLATASLELRDRTNLTAKLQSQVFGTINEKIVVLCGGEGCGKSWLFAQSWLTSDERTLTLVIPATDLQSDGFYNDIEDFLIDNLIEQTGDSASEFIVRRWENRFKQWKADQGRSSPKLVVFVDGLNQRLEFNWPRWLDGLSYTLEKLGGTLVISTRHGYFNSRLKNSLQSSTHVIKVGEWSDTELGEILSTKQIDPSRLGASVKKTLQNPRVLAIAFELLDNAHIQDFQELSIERLLFEHIRISARDGNSAEPTETFIGRLSSHAQEIINRVEQQKHEDKLIFESADFAGAPQYELSADLLAVSEERFFKALPEDSTRYSLTDDGLTYALGLSIIKSLQKAERNDGNLNEALDALLEPVAALDKTADAVFAAVLIASIDEQCTDPIRSALIGGYLRLQNINEHSYPAFASVARNATDASMIALFELAASPLHVAHGNWLVAALREQRHDTGCWEIISCHLITWMRLYSLSPEIALSGRPRDDSPEKVAEKIEEQGALIAKKLDGLSAAESEFLTKKMKRNDDVDISAFSEEIFAILAGMPLSPFAEALVAWAFSASLNSGFHLVGDEFQFAIQFNNHDWSETRDALLASASIFQGPETSTAGKWALVRILRATGTVSDTKRADILVEELTADREKFEGWRLVEKYCSTDPCDPSSEKPDNITDTAERYREIDLEKIKASRGMTQEDHFLRDARPGLARFLPDATIEVQRKVADKIIAGGDNLPMHGLFSLKDKTAILLPDAVSDLLRKASDLSGPYEEDASGANGRWVGSQYALLIALSHLSGNDQLEAFLSLPEHGPPLLELADILKPADVRVMEKALDCAVQSDDRNMQITVLMFARYSGTELSPCCRKIVRGFSSSSDRTVRGEALSIIAHLEDENLCKFVVDGGWTAQTLDARQNHFELWYGAMILTQAVNFGLLGPDEALDRMSPEHYDIAALRLGSDAKSLIRQRLNASISKSLEVKIPFFPPAVDQNLDDGRKAHAPSLKSLSHTDDDLGVKEIMERVSETSEEFAARQAQGWKAFSEFENALTNDKARLIVEHVGHATVMACVENASEMVEAWAREFLSLPDEKLMRVQNLGLTVAECLSAIDPALAKELFERLAGQRTFVNLVYGSAAIPFEAMCVWNSADNDEMNALREARLDSAPTDHAMAIEVLSALKRGKAEFLKCYVQKRLSDPKPAAIARALMVCGLGLESKDAEASIKRYADMKGILGSAAQAAQYAYERNCWSRHWFSKMCETSAAEEFWTFSVLFVKVVDARYELWINDFERKGEPIQNFGPSLRSKIENRVKDWQKKRDKKLFGFNAPHPMFVALN